MRSFVALIVLMLVFSVAYSQSPTAFKYQAVVRDISGNVLNDKYVSFRISILKGSSTGSSVFSESHSVKTNNFGVVNLEIGNGSKISGNMATIDWGSDAYFIQIEVDLGSGFVAMGTSQIMAVPFAFHAKTAETVTGITETDPVWSAIKNDYYKKNDMQTAGNSQVNFGNLINKPNTLAGYGIIDGITANHRHPNATISDDGFMSVGDKSKLDIFSLENIDQWNTAYRWGNHATAGYISTETDPKWTSDKGSYFNKTELQTSGSSQVNFGNLTNKPTTLSGYGITDAALASNVYTKTEMQTIGSSQVHFGNLTNTPTTIAGYGITDAYTKTELQTSGNSQVHYGNITNNPLSISSPLNNQLLKYNSTSSKWENWTPNYLTAETQALSMNSNTITLTPGNSVNLTSLALPRIIDSDFNTGVFVEANPNDNTIRFTINGIEKFTMNNSYIQVDADNVFLGNQSGNVTMSGVNNNFFGNSSGSANTTGQENNFIGYQAGKSNTIGRRNNFIGYLAGYSNTLGDYNNFIGRSAGYSNTSGLKNCFIGHAAGMYNNSGNDNVFIGTDAGMYNNEGDNNIRIGNSAGYYGLEGDNNICIGVSAGHDNAIGSNNIFLGRGAGYNNGGGSDNIFIGSDAGYNEIGSDKLYIDNSSTTMPLIFGDFNMRRLVINGNSSNNLNNRTFFVNGSAGGTGAWWNDSDIRLKKNINIISDALNKVMKLRGVNYEWIDDKNYGSGLQMGFIAQEAAEVIPEVVDKRNPERFSMQYAPITALLVEAIKVQQKEIEELKIKNAEIDNLKKEKKELEERLNVLNEKVNILFNQLNK